MMNMMNVAVDHVEGPTDGEDSIEVSNNIWSSRPQGGRNWVQNLEPLFGCGLADVLICRKGRDVQPLQCLAHRGERRCRTMLRRWSVRWEIPRTTVNIS